MRERSNQFIRKKRSGDAVEFISSSAMAYSAPATVPVSGDAGPGGSDTVAQLARHLLHVVGERCHVPFAVHLLQAPQPGLVPSQTVQGSEGSFRDGPPPKPLPLVCGDPVSCPGRHVNGVIHHPWLGNRRSPFALLLAVDDATGTVVDALFSEREDAHSYFVLMRGLVQFRGVPVALYTDRHGVFKHTPGSGLETRRPSSDGQWQNWGYK